MPRQNRFAFHFLQTLMLAVGILASVVTTGCGSTRINNQSSVGQQLKDLETSYKDGVITQKEYERLKKAIIKNND